MERFWKRNEPAIPPPENLPFFVVEMNERTTKRFAKDYKGLLKEDLKYGGTGLLSGFLPQVAKLWGISDKETNFWMVASTAFYLVREAKKEKKKEISEGLIAGGRRLIYELIQTLPEEEAERKRQGFYSGLGRTLSKDAKDINTEELKVELIAFSKD